MLTLRTICARLLLLLEIIVIVLIDACFIVLSLVATWRDISVRLLLPMVRIAIILYIDIVVHVVAVCVARLPAMTSIRLLLDHHLLIILTTLSSTVAISVL